MDRLDWFLMVVMAALVVASPIAAYGAGRYCDDYLLLLPVGAFWLVALIVGPMFALGTCGPQYRSRRLKPFVMRCLVIVLVLDGLLASTDLHRRGRVEMLKAMFTREVIAVIRSSSAAALAAHPDEQNLSLFDSELPAELKARVGTGWDLDIQRKKSSDPPLIRLWSGNHMFSCGIVMTGLSADSLGDVLENSINRETDEDTAYYPWLNGSMLFVGRDD